jgi:hypothetical protein
MRPNDSETFDAEWFFADDSAETLPFPTAFGSTRFNVDRTDYPGIGEIWEQNPPLSSGIKNPLTVGDHFCGDRQFWQEGWPVGTDTSAVHDCCPAEAPFDFGFDLGFES